MEFFGIIKFYKFMLVEDRYVEWIINSIILKLNDYYSMGFFWKYDLFDFFFNCVMVEICFCYLK